MRRGRPFRDTTLFANVSDQDWNDWRWQARSCIQDLGTLEQIFRLTPEERQGAIATQDQFQLSIPPYYALLADPDDPSCPVRMQAIPHVAEAQKLPTSLRDPLGEDDAMPVPGLVHRYPDRVLLLINNMCSMYCRYCTRKRLTGEDNETMPRADFERVLSYLRATPQVRDVLISGGDPLNISDRRLDEILGALRAIPSIEIIRMGTRMPVVMPQRITPELCAVLRKHHPFWVNTHFNHPKELTPEAIDACARLADAGIPLGNQTVLLRGVNSSALLLKDLFHRLVRARVRPYYLFQCDPAEGLEHFRTPVAKGVEIMEQLQGWTSGYAIPKLVIDAPGGGGKLPFGPQYVVSTGLHETVVRNFEFRTFRYPEPLERDCTVAYEDKWFAAAPPTAALEAQPPHHGSQEARASEPAPAKLRIVGGTASR
ncbi:MAG: KamA family radical SAM protein [Myxococcota bacterium]